MTQNVEDSIYKNEAFLAICKRYTDVMAHNHKLQSLLFTEDKLAADIAADITSLIIILENGTSKIQSFMVQYVYSQHITIVYIT